MLARLAELGIEMAEAAARQARDGAVGEGAPDPALRFARAARAVRLTIALETRLTTERAEWGRAEAARRRDRIHTRVERAAEAEHLSSAAWESLTETEDADLLDRPIEDVVARICADLGLSPGWTASAFGKASQGPLSGGADLRFSPPPMGEVAAEGGRRGQVAAPGRYLPGERSG